MKNYIYKFSLYDKVVLSFLFINLLTIRLVEYRVGDTNLLYIEPLFLILGLFVFFAIISGSKKFRFGKMLPYFIVFILYGAISFYMSIYSFNNEPADAFGKFRQICIYPVIFFFAYNLTSGNKLFSSLHKIFKFIVILYIPLALFAYLAGLRIFDPHGYFQLFSHWEGWIASYFIFYPVGSSLIKKKINKLDLIISIISAIIIILTVRRGLWLSASLSLIFIYVLLLYRSSLRVVLKHALTSIIIVILLLTAAEFIEPLSNSYEAQNITGRFNDMLVNLSSPDELQTGGTAYERIIRYYTGFKYFEDSPLLGQGIGFKTVFFEPNTYRTFYSLFHNAYLEILVSMGLVGLILFLIIHAKFVTWVIKIRKSAISNENLLYIYSLFGIYLTGMFWGLVDNTFVSNSNFIFTLYFIMGIIARYIFTNKLISKRGKGLTNNKKLLQHY